VKHKGDRFPGFPAGKSKLIPLPSLFFAELLPAIDDLSELKVTLHLFWRLSQQGRRISGLTLSELRQDRVLLRSLDLDGESPDCSLIREALNKASERGAVLRAKVTGEGKEEEWYFINTERGRDLLNRVRRGEVDLGGDLVLEEVEASEERPTIFVLYEQNIGLLQPLIVEELQDAELLYPPSWIEEAFRLAVENNVRKWRYVRAILERWQVEGRGDEELGRDYREDGRSYLKGKYTDFIKH
jgi:DnaD/phage-associated family protein